MFGLALPVTDRRDHPRTSCVVPVEVHIPSGIRRGVILDLSSSGIRIEMDSAPAVGTPALVKWDGQEVMGQIIWEKGGSCGMRFDRPLPDGLVEEVKMISTRRTGAAASVSNIQTGRRRSTAWKVQR